jgi:hypothetical protein
VLLANRARRDELRKLYSTTIAQIQQLAKACLPTDAEVSHPEYQTLITRALDVDAELAFYSDYLRGRPEWRECALDGETHTQARARLLGTYDATQATSWREETVRDVELRLLLERGESVYSITRTFDNSGSVADSSLRKRLERERARRLKQLTHESQNVSSMPQVLWILLLKAKRLRLDAGAEHPELAKDRYLVATESLVRALASTRHARIR